MNIWRLSEKKIQLLQTIMIYKLFSCHRQYMENDHFYDSSEYD
jgi:hypothetical protein